MLNQRQIKVLRKLATETRPTPDRDFPASTLQELEQQGLIQIQDHQVHITEEGKSYFQTQIRRRRRVSAPVPRPQSKGEQQSGPEERKELLKEALQLLHQALPSHRVLHVGDLSCSTEQMLQGLETYASQNHPPSEVSPS